MQASLKFATGITGKHPTIQRQKQAATEEENQLIKENTT